MDARAIQQQLFKKIREQLPEHLSLADELSGLVGLSADSVYRRIRVKSRLTLMNCRRSAGIISCVRRTAAAEFSAVLFQAPGVSNWLHSICKTYGRHAGRSAISTASKKGRSIICVRIRHSGISSSFQPWPVSSTSSGAAPSTMNRNFSNRNFRWNPFLPKNAVKPAGCCWKNIANRPYRTLEPGKHPAVSTRWLIAGMWDLREL